MAAGRPQRIEQTRAATPMDTDGAVTPVELLQHVAVGGQGQNPGAHKRVRRGGPRTDDRKQTPPGSACRASRPRPVRAAPDVRGDRPRATDLRSTRRSAKRSDARSPGQRRPIRRRCWAAREGAPPPSIVRLRCGPHRAPATTTPAPVRQRSGPSCQSERQRAHQRTTLGIAEPCIQRGGDQPVTKQRLLITPVIHQLLQGSKGHDTGSLAPPDARA